MKLVWNKRIVTHGSTALAALGLILLSAVGINHSASAQTNQRIAASNNPIVTAPPVATALPIGNVNITVTITPTPLVVGQVYTTQWTSSNATGVFYNCTSSGGGFVDNGYLPSTSGTLQGTALSAWVGHDSQCTYTAEDDINGYGKFVTKTLHTIAAPLPTPTCTSVAMQAPSTTATSGTFRAYAYGVTNASGVTFPTWGDTGGQDDIFYYPGINDGGGTWHADINLANHKASAPEFGNFNTHAYMQTTDSQNVFCNGSVWTRTAPAQSGTLTTSLPFGNVTVSANSTLNAILTNNGTVPLNVTLPPAVSGTDFSYVGTDCPASLATNYYCTINVKFAPTAATTRAGTLSVGTGAGTLSASLTGAGIAAVPGTFTYVGNGGHSSNGNSGDLITFTIKNSGTGTITSVSAACSGASFYNSGSFSPTTLAPGASGTITCQAAASGGYSAARVTMTGSNATNSGVLFAETPPPPTPPALSLGTCINTTPTISPTAATMSCPLTNTGAAAISSIAYSPLSNMSTAGSPTSCAASSSCGTVIVTTNTAYGTYSGTLSITPSTGTGTSTPVSLQVNPPVLNASINTNPLNITIAAAGVGTGAVTVSASGGVPAYTYSWAHTTGNLSSISSSTTNNPTFSATLGANDSFTENWTVTIRDNAGTTKQIVLPVVFKVVPDAPPTITATRTPPTMIANQNQFVTWTTTNATSVSYVCTASGTGFKGNGVLPSVNGSTLPSLADPDWVGFDSACTYTATGPGGIKTFDETLHTIRLSQVGNAPTATLSASLTNVRIAANATVAINFTGQSTDSDGQVVRLDLYKDYGSGAYDLTPVTSIATNSSSVPFNYAHQLGAGTYRFKLRSTDSSGNFTESAPVVINATTSALLGTVSGVRSQVDGSALLYGWTCESGFPQALNYQVYANAPSTQQGGTLLTSGVANVATEVDNSTVQSTCATPGAAHHFTVDLTRMATLPNPGSRIFVQVTAASSSATTVLPCDDSNCTMPSSLRIGLTTPEDNSHYTAPATAFLRAKLSNGVGPYDEIAFSVDGVWAAGAPDGAVDTYSYSKSGLAARAAPYIVMAKVRKGNSTIYSAANRIYVDAGSATTVTLNSPTNGNSFVAGATIPLSATPAGVIITMTSVQFYSNDVLIANGVNNNGIWSPATPWVNYTAGTYNITARAFNGVGALLATSPVTTIMVTSGTGPSSPDPIAVNITPPHLLNPDAGSLPGNLNVSASGSAGYSIPIALPPGIAGMVPHVSLDYSSDNTTGSAGLGWSVGGISHIDRCGKTVAVDGIADAVRFSAMVEAPPYDKQPTDRLCLDGQRLILINGDKTSNFAYWADGAEYRTEIESLSKITAQVTSINGSNVRTFKVETKDGQILDYGNTVDSYLQAEGRTDNLAHRWRLSRRQDRSGNYISYIYKNNAATGENKPLEMRWGGNVINGQSHFAKVVFDYGTVDRPDPRSAFVGGSHVDERWRLNTINTFTDIAADGSGGVKANNYNLTYEISPTSGRSLLKTVQICDAVNVCLPITKFEWGTPNPSAKKEFAILGGTRIGPNLATIGAGAPLDAIIASDFNGDGKTDILERYRTNANGNQQTLYTSNASGTDWIKSTPFAHIPGNLAVMEIGDFDGDGLLDVLVADQPVGGTISNWRMCWGRLKTVDRYDCSQVINFPADAMPGLLRPVEAASPTRLVKDFNADGKDDIYLREGKLQRNAWDVNANAYTCLSNGTSFNCIKVAGSGVVGQRNAIEFGEGTNGEVIAGTIFADMDGDGRADKIVVGKCVWRDKPNGGQPPMEWYCGDSGIASIKISSQTEPSGFKFQGQWLNFPDRQSRVMMPALNGTFSSDLNADGYSDIVLGTVNMAKMDAGQVATAYGSQLCYSKGDGFAECKPLPISNLLNGLNLDHLVLNVNDYDGDGIQDVLRPGHDTWAVSNINQKYQLCHIGPNASFQRCEEWAGPIFYQNDGRVASEAGNDLGTLNPQYSMFYGDFDGDGKQDIVSYLGGTDWQIFSAADQAKANEALDKLVSVTNGLGLVERVDYAKTNDSTVYSAAVQNPAGGAMPIVGKSAYPHRQLIKALHRSNGQGGWLDTTYHYGGFASDGQGRGSLGFARVDSTNVQTNITNSTWYEQSFPNIGAVKFAQTRAGNGLLLSDSSVSLSYVTTDKGTVIPYSPSSKTIKKELINGNDLGTTDVTSSAPDSIWGNVSSRSTASYLSTTPSLIYTSAQSSVFTTGTWPQSFLSKLTETKTVPGSSSSSSRTVDYTYDTSGRVATETRQKGDPVLQTTTTYDRSTGGSAFGLVNKTVLAWFDPVSSSNKVRTVSDVSYTTNGRFPQTSKNALGQVTSTQFDARHGAMMLRAALPSYFQSNYHRMNLNNLD